MNHEHAPSAGLERPHTPRRRTHSRFRGPRIAVSLLMIGAVTWSFFSLGYPLPGQAYILEYFSRLDPLTALAVWLRQGQVQTWFAAGLGLLAATLLLGRFFCSWLCPFGALLSILDEARLAISRRRRPRPPLALKPPAWAETLNHYRYIFLVAVLLLMLTGTFWPLLLTPSSLIGHEMRQVVDGSPPYVFLLVLLLGLPGLTRFWCAYLCPTGLLLQAAGRWRRWGFRLGRRCNACGLCVPACPTAAIDLSTRCINESCTLCGACADLCHRQGVEFGRLHPLSAADPLPLRRGLLQLLGAGLLWIPLAALFKPGQEARAAFIRPPGALPESQFIDTCIRCHRCVQVCPTGTLRPLGFIYGLRVLDSPALHPELARCELEMLCAEVCPVTAIRPLPLEKVKMGLAVIEREKCLNWQGEALCLLCLEQCPVQAIYKDGRQRPHVRDSSCTGCGSCEFGCPARPRAVVVHALE